jgi:hypothetical protein
LQQIFTTHTQLLVGTGAANGSGFAVRLREWHVR